VCRRALVRLGERRLVDRVASAIARALDDRRPCDLEHPAGELDGLRTEIARLTGLIKERQEIAMKVTVQGSEKLDYLDRLGVRRNGRSHRE